MALHPLPVINLIRTEFGFGRTVCGCHDCTLNCHHLPGYLIPADLERMHRHLAPGEDLAAWAHRYLLASPGALVLRQGQPCRIPTLVPARRTDGACIFLTDTNQCAIHAVSPFGCAFFDFHMRQTEADQRSKRGLQAVLEAWDAGDPYAQLWVILAAAGLVAPAPEVARQQLQQAHENERPR
jgi:Fe-S-cluster containining protein